jgi:hypothetical protein
MCAGKDFAGAFLLQAAGPGLQKRRADIISGRQRISIKQRDEQ